MFQHKKRRAILTALFTADACECTSVQLFLKTGYSYKSLRPTVDIMENEQLIASYWPDGEKLPTYSLTEFGKRATVAMVDETRPPWARLIAWLATWWKP